QAYRDRYRTCHRQYSLAVPFLERILSLAVEGGFTGQITANSFMKREFGKKLIEEFFPGVDLTHVIDTSGAFIPGHGTPTLLLFARNQRPVSSTLRTVMGIRGEPSTPEDPSRGLVWSAIVAQVDRPGSKGEYVSVIDTGRALFHTHPWSIGGGGAAELKQLLEKSWKSRLGDSVEAIGRTTVVGEDDAWVMDDASTRRKLLADRAVDFCVGDVVRDWVTNSMPKAIYPYKSLGGDAIGKDEVNVLRHLWPLRTSLQSRTVFGKSLADMGRPWWEHLEHYRDKLR